MEIYDESVLTPYEILRQNNIISNYQFMKACGLPVKPLIYVKERAKVDGLHYGDSACNTSDSSQEDEERKISKAKGLPFKPLIYVKSTQIDDLHDGNIANNDQPKEDCNKKKPQMNAVFRTLRKVHESDTGIEIYTSSQRRGKRKKPTDQNCNQVKEQSKSQKVDTSKIKIEEVEDIYYVGLCKSCDDVMFGDCPEHGPLLPLAGNVDKGKENAKDLGIVNLKKVSHRCKNCRVCFTAENYLISHMRRCKIKNKDFIITKRKNEVDIIAEEKVKISGLTKDKLVKCTNSEYENKIKNNLAALLKNHTGEKPFKSNQYNYECLDKSNFRRHIKIRTGEKPFKCNHCNYECAHKSNLTKHIKIHTGEKPFKCNHCDYECFRKDHLTTHKSSHWRETIQM